MKKAIIFDMDGVLVDNRDIHMEAFETFAERHGLEVTREKLLLTFGKTNDQIFDALFGEGKYTAEEKHAMGIEKEIIYRDIFEQKIEPAPGLVRLLKELKTKGIKMAVGSSGPLPNVEFVLERCGISEYFDALAHGGIISKGKPDPEVFLLAAELLGATPDECIVFEDAIVGIEAARRAGMTVVAMDTTFPAGMLSDYDLLIHDFTEIDASIVDKF